MVWKDHRFSLAERIDERVKLRAMTSLRILLVDDHAMFRTGLRMVLVADLPGAQVIEAASTDEAMRVEASDIDVALLDVKLNGLNGLESIALLRRKWPSAPILMLSSEDRPETVSLALARGAASFVSKAEPAERIIEAIHLALAGEGERPDKPKPTAPTARCLTPRQCEVLDLLNQGLSNKLIARRLALSNNTVRRHVQDILEFYDVASRAEAVFAARRQGHVA